MKQYNGVDEQDSTRRRGIYLLPNFFTTIGLFSGFYSIVASMKGLFVMAAIATFIAMLADSLDGRVARMTNTQSDFGAEYDSLSDMVAFGIAPALLVYSWAMHNFGKIGWLVAFFYAATTALRLARFNVAPSSSDKRFFYGIPCPAAAGLVTSLVWVLTIYNWHAFTVRVIVAAVTVLVGILMVSNVPYRSFKDLDMRGSVPFITLIVILCFLLAIALEPPEVLFTIFAIYVLSGPFAWVWRFLRKKRHIKVVE